MVVKNYTSINDNTFYIAHDGEAVFHFAKMINGTQVSTGQAYLEIYDTRENWEARLIALGQTIPEEESPFTILD